ncbi:uncharacterized protein LOC133201892 [Saccostrea echinata]|uniref:uncharacterized protein LOC133201892 n=1 Tax=Saccostrea echinata TaxID=191078 RepID=UPI002A81DEBB|nr:uncharacterized protein LOC133201892 [Saccostrea echinata]
MPEVVNSTKIIDDTDVTPMPEEEELTDTPDETCWHFEKERCNELPNEWRIPCTSDSFCKGDGVNKGGECCSDPCEYDRRVHPDYQTFCRWPTDNYDILQSFRPVSSRPKK